mgnify:CR=1 FL=1
MQLGKLLKYLKDYKLQVLAIVVLLIIQAFFDLALPEYTSNIVDVGIQQGGIEDTLPEVIRKSQYDKISLFLSDGAFEKEYSAVSAGDESYKDEYPEVMNQDLMIRKNESYSAEAEKEFEVGAIILSSMSKDSEKMTGMSADEFFETAATLKGTENDMTPMVYEKTSEQMSQMPESIVKQSVMAFIKSEYEACGVDLSAMQNSYLFRAGIKMLGCSMGIMAMSIIVGFLASIVAAKIGKTVREGLFRKVVSFSGKEMNDFSTASLITRSTNDIQQIQMVTVMLLRMVLYAPILGIGGVLKVLNTDTSMAWVIAVGVAAVMVLVGLLMKVAMPKFKIMQTLVDKLNLVAREILTGLPVIRAFSREKHEEERFDKANRELTRTHLFTNRVMTFMMPVMMLIMNGISVLIIWVGSHGVDTGKIQVGDMMAFINYTMIIIMSFLMITMISVMAPRAAVSADRINEVMKTEPSIKDGSGSLPESVKGEVCFNNVSFTYAGADEKVLANISFTAKPGQTTAVIGSTGSGKSTLVNLIPRFYDVTEGSVTIDGIDIRTLREHDLRAIIGYVPQKAVLFSGTIASNLRFGDENASDDIVRKAAEIAQASEFVESKPRKFASEISQGGGNVSGGQKQRLSIARAIAKNPKIYVFDDSFSALDYKTDVKLREALKKEVQDSTVIIVAQRISTILNADQIIVLDEGRIAGIGSHKELMADCDIYRQIAYSQLSEKELSGGEQ